MQISKSKPKKISILCTFNAICFLSRSEATNRKLAWKSMVYVLTLGFVIFRSINIIKINPWNLNCLNWRLNCLASEYVVFVIVLHKKVSPAGRRELSGYAASERRRREKSGSGCARRRGSCAPNSGRKRRRRRRRRRGGRRRGRPRSGTGVATGAGQHMRKCCNTETIYSGFDFGKVSVSVSVPVPDWFQIQTILSIFFHTKSCSFIFIIRSSINAQTRASHFFIFYLENFILCI